MSFFRLYDENGHNVLGVLPDAISWSLGVEFNEVGAFQMEYARDGVNADQISALREIALFDDIGNEIANGRFVIQNIRVSDTDKSTLQITGKSFLSYFDTALAYPEGNIYSSTTNRIFTGANAGYILKTLIDDAHMRGAIADMSMDFTGSVDSNGAAWTETTTIEIDARLSILSIMRSLSDQGLVEFSTAGHTLRAYKAGTYGTDHTTGGNPLFLAPGLSVTEAPIQIDATNLATAAFVIGDNNVRGQATYPLGVGDYGRREIAISASGVTTNAQASSIGAQIAANSAAPIKEHTLGLTVDDPNTPQPFENFTVGDWIYYKTGSAIERLRVRQVSLSMSASGERSATAILGDRIYENSVKLAQNLNRLTANSRQAGTGKLPDPVVEATTPTNVTLTAPFETVAVTNDAPPSEIFVDVLSAGVNYYTQVATSSSTLYVRGDDTTSLDSIMDIGKALSVVVVIKNDSTHTYYPGPILIDGSIPTIHWLEGSTPSASTSSNASTAYTLTIIKTDDATFEVLGSVANYS